ncbi:hypothetical protein OROMI_028476 [Orobanche minor]
MNLKNKNLNTLYFVLILSVFAGIGFCNESLKETKLGGLRDVAQNSREIESIGRFAVRKYNSNQNAVLEFVRVVKAKAQVVEGKLYHLTLEAVDGRKKKIYEAKVWVKPWMNFKQLREFKPAANANPSLTSSDLGVIHGVVEDSVRVGGGLAKEHLIVCLWPKFLGYEYYLCGRRLLGGMKLKTANASCRGLLLGIRIDPMARPVDLVPCLKDLLCCFPKSIDLRTSLLDGYVLP